MVLTGKKEEKLRESKCELYNTFYFTRYGRIYEINCNCRNYGIPREAQPSLTPPPHLSPPLPLYPAPKVCNCVNFSVLI